MITVERKQSWRKLAYTSGLALSLDELHYISVARGGGGSSTHMSCPGFITVCKNTAISRRCRTFSKLYNSLVSAFCLTFRTTRCGLLNNAWTTYLLLEWSIVDKHLRSHFDIYILLKINRPITWDLFFLYSLKSTQFHFYTSQ